MEEDKRLGLMAVIISFLTLSVVSISMRLFVRRFMVKLVGWDDMLAVIAMIPVLIHATLQLMATKYGLGLHFRDVAQVDFPNLLHLLWWSGIVYNLSHMLVKLSYLALYLRIMTNRAHRIMTYATAGLVVTLGVSYIFVSIFMCTPIEKGWNPQLEGTCVDSAGYLISNAAFNMTSDVIIFLLPLPTLWSLQHPTWDLASVILWSEVEVNLAVVLSCTAAFKSLIQMLFPGIMGSLVNGSRSGKTYATQNNVYILQSRGHDDDGAAGSGFRTVVSACPRLPDDETLNSCEHIVKKGQQWPRLETTVSVHSSFRESIDAEVPASLP
ncbi:hypothetical protein GQ53DRAFT_812093 [Thozetella sp. PMI_491]|nr:hypothetical protein GQ53DRAFT_812093 [Thozetella sp. PMI_491]